MTESNALECIDMLKAAFPSYKLSGDQTEKTMELWADIFEKTDVEKVKAAITTYVKSGAEFPPAVGQIRRLVNARNKKDDPDGDAGGYWMFETYYIPAKDVRVKTPEGLVPVYEPDDVTPIEYGRRIWVEAGKEKSA